MRAQFAALVACALIGCGGRTPLAINDPPLDAGLVDVGVDAYLDVGVDAGVRDSGQDARLVDACVPMGAEVCNGIDDDCNGFVDDRDVGRDGVTDCLRILLLGDTGENESDSFQSWLQEQGAGRWTRDHTRPELGVLTASQLSDYDVVILDRLVRGYSDAEASALEQWVSDGGGVISLSGYANQIADRTRPNSLLRPFGLRYPDTGPRLEGPVTMFGDHPTAAGLSSLTFAGGYSVGRRVEARGIDATEVAFVEGRTRWTVGLASNYGQGRVFLWGDDWVEYNTEWMDDRSDARVFWINVLGWTAHVR